MRDREGDIPLLAGFFLKRSCSELGLPEVAMTKDAMDLLREADLPGNVRQLQNLVRKAVLYARGFSVDAQVLGELLEGGDTGSVKVNEPISVGRFCEEFIKKAAASGSENAYHEILGEIEPLIFSEAMEQCDGNLSRGAALLGISRLTLREKLKNYGLR